MSIWNKQNWIKDILSKSGTEITEINEDKTEGLCHSMYIWVLNRGPQGAGQLPSIEKCVIWMYLSDSSHFALNPPIYIVANGFFFFHFSFGDLFIYIHIYLHNIYIRLKMVSIHRSMINVRILQCCTSVLNKCSFHQSIEWLLSKVQWTAQRTHANDRAESRAREQDREKQSERVCKG